MLCLASVLLSRALALCIRESRTDCLQGSDVNPIVGKYWYAWASIRTCNTQTCMLVTTCRWHFHRLAPWPRKGDRISEPPHWISQEYSVHNGKRRRRPPPICWSLCDTGWTLLGVGASDTYFGLRICFRTYLLVLYQDYAMYMFLC